jgi:DNA-binding transcriptional ArsR family regulator
MIQPGVEDRCKSHGFSTSRQLLNKRLIVEACTSILSKAMPLDSDSGLHHHARLLAALANDKRLQIMAIISQKEMGVGELAARVGLSQSALSQHLAKLRADKLVETRRDAQNIYYSTRHPGVRRILATLEEMYVPSKL